MMRYSPSKYTVVAIRKISWNEDIHITIRRRHSVRGKTSITLLNYMSINGTNGIELVGTYPGKSASLIQF